MSYRGEFCVVHLDYMEVRLGDCLAVFPAFTSPGPIKLRIFNYSLLIARRAQCERGYRKRMHRLLLCLPYEQKAIEGFARFFGPRTQGRPDFLLRSTRHGHVCGFH
jgi:hypothetical protein